jgi:hypothetical protein
MSMALAWITARLSPAVMSLIAISITALRGRASAIRLQRTWAREVPP